jgi:hypothetical protein
MNPADFTAEKNGRLLKTQQDYWAFLPNPLPPQLTLSWDLVNQLSEADRALSELAGTARTLPNPHLLIGPFIRREAVLSSRIEGTRRHCPIFCFLKRQDRSIRKPRMRGKYPIM